MRISFFLIRLALLGGLFLSASSFGMFDPERLSQSTVRVVIKHQGAVVSVATGFVWKKPDQIVTSLHVVHPDPKAVVIIEFGRKRRKASIKAVLPDADLVLLTVKRPIKDWLPLETFNPEKPAYRATVTALGFNRGSLGMSTRDLVKGYAKPEVLQQLLPGQAAAILAKTRMPSVTLPIYYLDGSLLPGYSGSPIVNTGGDLIGIGNGGLENGAANVSWVIPANFLSELEKSSITALPPQMAESSKLFSLDRSATQPKKVSWRLPGWLPLFITQAVAGVTAESAVDPDLITPIELPPLVSVDYQQFTFVKVKTRRFAQMVESSGTPEQLQHAMTIFNRVFPDITIDMNNQFFDVYADGFYGLNIVVPQGSRLENDGGYLLAQSDALCRTCPFELQYHARLLGKNIQQLVRSQPDGFLNHVADEHWDELNQEGDYDEYQDLRQIARYGNHRYILRALFSDFAEPFKDQFELNYFSAVTSRDAWFQAQAIVNVFDQPFMSAIRENRGLNCTRDRLTNDQAAFCDKVATTFAVITATHLTSFSNQLFKNAVVSPSFSRTSKE